MDGEEGAIVSSNLSCDERARLVCLSPLLNDLKPSIYRKKGKKSKPVTCKSKKQFSVYNTRKEEKYQFSSDKGQTYLNKHLS
jgi:hypothetical protein